MSLLSLSKKILRNQPEATKEAKAAPAAKQPKKAEKKQPVAQNNLLSGAINLSVIVSEKAIRQQAGQTLVVQVTPKASKGEIAAAVEQLFRVKVLSVRTLRQHPKIRRRGVTQGKTMEVKKAYVTVDDISKLNVAP